jgi:hypothetical protein
MINLKLIENNLPDRVTLHLIQMGATNLDKMFHMNSEELMDYWFASNVTVVDGQLEEAVRTLFLMADLYDFIEEGDVFEWLISDYVESDLWDRSNIAVIAQARAISLTWNEVSKNNCRI